MRLVEMRCARRPNRLIPALVGVALLAGVALPARAFPLIVELTSPFGIWEMYVGGTPASYQYSVWWSTNPVAPTCVGDEMFPVGGRHPTTGDYAIEGGFGVGGFMGEYVFVEDVQIGGNDPSTGYLYVRFAGYMGMITGWQYMGPAMGPPWSPDFNVYNATPINGGVLMPCAAPPTTTSLGVTTTTSTTLATTSTTSTTLPATTSSTSTTSTSSSTTLPTTTSTSSTTSTSTTSTTSTTAPAVDGYERGKSYFIAVPRTWPTALTAGTVFGSKLPVATQVFSVDGSITNMDARTIMGWSTNTAFRPGAGYRLTLPPTGTQLVYQVTFGGNLATNSAYPVTIATGENWLGYPLPTNVLFGSTVLYTQAQPGDTLRMPIQGSTSFVDYVKPASGPWDAASILVPANTGYVFINTGSEYTIMEGPGGGIDTTTTSTSTTSSTTSSSTSSTTTLAASTTTSTSTTTSSSTTTAPAAPIVGRAAPANGPAAGGNVVLVVGSGFGGTVTNVALCGLPAAILSQNATSVTVRAAGGGDGVGDVVVALASGGSGVLTNGYRYNMAGAIHGEFVGWRSVSNLPAAHERLAAAAVGDTLYSLGGDLDGSEKAYRYDTRQPQAGWTAISNLPTALWHHAAASAFGRVYTFGGWIVSTAYGYTPASPVDGWQSISNLPAARSHLSGGSAHGKLYAMGGFNGSYFSSVDVYDPLKPWEGWQEGVSLPYTSHQHGGGGYNGHLYLVGGESDPTGVLVFDPLNTAAGWTSISNLPAGVTYPAVAGVNGRVFCIGGSYVSSVYMFNTFAPSAGWQTVSNLPDVRQYLGATAARGCVYAIGGNNGSVAVSTVYEGFFAPGLSATHSPSAGGGTVVIDGSFLGDGSDVTNVTLAGIRATIVSQSATQLVVTAGAAPGAVSGPVRVQSVSRGETVSEALFTYDGEATTTSTTTTTSSSSSSTSTSTTTSSSTTTTTTTTASTTTTSSTTSTTAPAVGIVPAHGPAAGGNTVTIASPGLGNGEDITTVTLCGWPATILSQSSNQVTVRAVGLGEGPGDVVVQSASAGATVFTNAYTYNMAGSIHGKFMGWREIMGWPSATWKLAAAGAGGKIYAVGGATNTARVYDPSQDRQGWLSISNVPAALNVPSLVAVGSRLFTIGGDSSSSNVYAYDTANPSAGWSLYNQLPRPVDWGGAAAVNGILYAVGGWNVASTVLSTVVACDTRIPGAGWTAVSNLPASLYGHGAAATRAFLCAAGGLNATDVPQAGAIGYRPWQGASGWGAISNLAGPRYGVRLCARNGLFYALGGWQGSTMVNGVQTYDPLAPARGWQTSSNLPSARNWMGAAAAGGSLYSVAGWNGSSGTTNCYEGWFASGVAPLEVSPTGGARVVISGTEFGDGGDITNVTLAGIAATIVSQSATQVVIIAGVAPGNTSGVVRVESTSRGVTESPDRFVYKGRIFSVDPPQGPAAGGGIVLYGDSLAGGSPIAAVYIGGQQARVEDAGELSMDLTIPGGDPGTVDIVIRYANGEEIVAVGAYTYTTPGVIHGEFAGWRAISNLPATRYSHALVAAGGRLYAVGGYNVNTAWSYDPQQPDAGWTSISNLPTTLYDHSAAVLHGRIHVLGGYAPGGITTNIWVYDPAAPSAGWQPGAPLPLRLRYGAAAGAGGKLYAFGGINDTDAALQWDPLYPARGWTSIANMPCADWGIAGAAWQGHVYAVSLENAGSGGVQKGAAWFDPANPAAGWTALPNMPAERFYAAAAAVNGHLFVLGGQSGSIYGDVFGLELGAPGASWTACPPLPAVRNYHAAAALNGNVYVAGGNDGVYHREVWVSVFAGGVSPPQSPLEGGGTVVISGTALGDGSDISMVTLCGVPATIVSQSATQVVVVAGASGVVTNGDVLVVSSAHGPTVAAGAFSYRSLAEGSIAAVTPDNGPASGGNTVVITGAGMGGASVTNVTLSGVPAAIVSLTATSITVTAGWGGDGTGAVVIDSYSNGMTRLADAYTYNPAGAIHGTFDRWVPIPDLPAVRRNLSAVGLGGKVYGLGGKDGSAAMSAVLAYDPRLPEAGWTWVTNMPAARWIHGSAVIGSEMFVIGGADTSLSRDTVWSLDPTNLAAGWRTWPPLPATNALMAVAAMNRCLYVAGGSPMRDSTLVLDTTCPGAGWRALPDLPEPRADAGGAAARGQFIVVGGYNETTTDRNQLFGLFPQRASPAWAGVSALPAARQHPGATMLNNRLHAVGGYGSGVANTAWSLDPANAAAGWTTLPNLPAYRTGAGVAAAAGRLYVLGGWDGSAYRGECFEGRYQPGFTPRTLPVAGNVTVTINGSQLGNGADITAVTLAGVPAAIVSQSATQVVVTAGAAAGVSCGPVRVVSTSRGETLSTDNIAYLGSILGVSPTAGPAAGGQTVTLAGANLLGGATVAAVYLGGAPASLVGSSETQLVVTAGANTEGTGDVVVRYANGAELMLPNAYTYHPGGSIHGDFVGWRRVADLPEALSDHAAASLDGKVYVFGGYSSYTNVYVYDALLPSAGWKWTNALPTGLNAHGGATLGKRLYALGGSLASGNYVAAWAAGLPGEVWHPTTRLNDNLGSYSRVAGLGGKLYGFGGNGAVSAVRVFDPLHAADGWSSVSNSTNADYGYAVAALGGRLYLVAAENTTSANVQKGLISYDPLQPAAGWLTHSNMPMEKYYLAAAAVNGRIFAIGGASGSTIHSNVCVYTLAAGWGTVTNLPIPLYHTAAAAARGRVYAIGGQYSGSLRTNAVFEGSFAAGVSATNGPTAGGTTITITGTGLGSGSDITTVTIAGVAAVIVSQSDGQVVVTTGAAGEPVSGPVRVFSTSRGMTESETLFTYEGEGTSTTSTTTSSSSTTTSLTVTTTSSTSTSTSSSSSTSSSTTTTTTTTTSSTSSTTLTITTTTSTTTTTSSTTTSSSSSSTTTTSSSTTSSSSSTTTTSTSTTTTSSTTTTAPANLPPYWTSTPVTNAEAGAYYEYVLTAVDPNGDALQYRAPALPAWLSLVTNAPAIPAGTVMTVAGTGVTDFSGDGGPATNATFNRLWTVAANPAGGFCIGDHYNSRVRRVNAAGIVSTAAGTGANGFSGDGGPATNAALYQPMGVAFDNRGRLLIADYENCRIRRVDTNGIISTIAGTGSRSFSGDGGPATSAALFLPVAVAADAQGRIYVGDQANHRIRRIDTNGVITTVAGTGTAGYGGDGGPATAARLNNPDGVAVDAAGNLYIGDYSNHRVRMVATNGIIRTIAGTGVAGYSGSGGPATNATLNFPTEVAVDAAGNVYVACLMSHVVQRIATNGIIATMAGTGTEGFLGDGGPATNAWLRNPSGVSIDAAGNLYIADYNNVRVRKVYGANVPATLKLVGTPGAGNVGSTNITLIVSDGVTDVPQTFLLTVRGPFVDITNVSATVAYAVTNAAIGGTATDVAGMLRWTNALNGAAGLVAVANPFTIASIPLAVGPNAITVRGTNFWGIATQDTVTLTRDSSTTTSTTTTSTTTTSSTTTSTTTSSTSSTTSTTLSSSSTTTSTTTSSSTSTSSTSSTTTAPSGPTAWISAPVTRARVGHVYRYLLEARTPPGTSPTFTAVQIPPWLTITNEPRGIIRTDAGIGAMPGSAFVNGIPATQALLSSPQCVAVDPRGGYAIADSALIRRVGADNIIRHAAGNGSFGTQLVGDGGVATLASVWPPTGIAYDRQGNLYLVSPNEQRVRKVDMYGIMTTIAGDGYAGYNGDSRPASGAKLYNPFDVGTDAAGNVYIADSFNKRIRKIDAAGTITTVAGTGAYGPSGDGGPATAASIGEPHVVDVDANGSYYIAQYNGGTDDRVRFVNTSGIITTIAGGGPWQIVEGSAATNSKLSQVAGICHDRAGNVYFSDGSSRVYMVDTNGILTRFAGGEPYGNLGDGQAATNATLKKPLGLDVTPAARLYIADYDNCRVRQVGLGGVLLTGIPGPGNVGTANIVLRLSDGANSVLQSFTLRVLDFRSPTNLTATAGAAGIALAWADNNIEEIGYIVERRASPFAVWTRVGTLPANSAAYTDAGVSAGQTYYYRVSVWTENGAETPGTEVSAQMPAGPAAPANLTATATGTDRIALSWVDASNNETHFELQRRVGLAGIWTALATPSANSRTYTDTGLAPNTLHCYRLRAVNAIGTSAFTPEACDTTQKLPDNDCAYALWVTRTNLTLDTVPVRLPATGIVETVVGGTLDVRQTSPRGIGSVQRVVIGFRDAAGYAAGTPAELLLLYGAPGCPGRDMPGVPLPADFRAPVDAGIYSLWVEAAVTADDPAPLFLERVHTNETATAKRLGTVVVKEGASDKTTVILANTEGIVGTDIRVPILINSTGGEVAVSFSLAYNASILAPRSVASGPSAFAAWVRLNTNQTGRVGVLAILPDEQAMPAGAKHAFTVTFGALQTGIVAVTFGDLPTARDIGYLDVEAIPDLVWLDGTVTVVDPGYEGDVAPRPRGDRAITAADVALMDLILLGEDRIADSNEFRRADCVRVAAKGDGLLTLSDRTQIRRWIGTSPLTPVGGPWAPQGGFALALRGESDRQLAAGSLTTNRGTTFWLPLTLAAQGNENALSLSVHFDSELLTFLDWRATNAATNAVTLSASVNAGDGAVGLLLSMPTNQVLPAGTYAIAELAFQSAAGASTTVTPVTFADSPTARGVSDSAAEELACTYAGGTLTLTADAAPGAPAAPSALAATAVGTNQVNLAWSDMADDEAAFVVHRRREAGAWSELAALPANTTAYADAGLTGGTTYRYLVEARNAAGSSYSDSVTATTWTALDVWRLNRLGQSENAGLAADNADWDGDGIPNLLEYALDLDPTSEEDAITLFTMQVRDGVLLGTDRFMTATYHRGPNPPTDASVGMDLSTNLLSGWSQQMLPVDETPTGSVIRVRVRSDAPFGSRKVEFIRMHAEPATP